MEITVEDIRKKEWEKVKDSRFDAVIHKKPKEKTSFIQKLILLTRN